MSGPFRHRISVRFGEVDQQGVVFNAHYLAYMDDAMETWMRAFPDLRQTFGWDMMLKKCTLEWQGSVGNGREDCRSTDWRGAPTGFPGIPSINNTTLQCKSW